MTVEDKTPTIEAFEIQAAEAHKKMFTAPNRTLADVWRREAKEALYAAIRLAKQQRAREDIPRLEARIVRIEAEFRTL